MCDIGVLVQSDLKFTTYSNSLIKRAHFCIRNTVKPVFKTTWEIGTTLKLRTATSVPMPIQYIEMDLRNETTSDFRTVFHSPLGVPNSHVSLYSYPLHFKI